MNPLNDDKLEKISNHELIRRIMELQNSLIIISDHMEFLKNKNRILDEENEKLENHIRDIVNDVKTELTQKFDKKKSPPLTYAPVIREEEAAIEQCNGCDNERSVQREPCEEQTCATPDSVVPVPTNAASPRRSISCGDSSSIQHTTNVQSWEHTNRAYPDKNETKIAQTSYEKNSDQHVNNMRVQKKEEQNLNLLKEHTKSSNIYNLLMETEKLNSIFNIASNVLNTSFFGIASKEQDGKRKACQSVQGCPGVEPRELHKHTQRGGSKTSTLEANPTEATSEANNYMDCSGGDVPAGGVAGKENTDIMDRVDIMEDEDINEKDKAQKETDIKREVLMVEENPIASHTNMVVNEIPIKGGYTPDDQITTPPDSHQMDENIHGGKDNNDEENQVNHIIPDEGDTIKRESYKALV
ncbi:hypothetical protein AK88_00232 [Plasmodium fragile]|uniref:Uncharacterized protein n=1 Tax=Plasmodium fragile TaxID=5857 RepID=A0A0D9QSV9_PLAFR|nr:uncharacterized protein AK88_00232 [Plasmodium fragile]KJP90063.1 hypothetical protein AK88_00232 [Plasmodium fragile]